MNEEIILSDYVYVMGSELLYEWTPEQIANWYEKNPGEQKLATAFAVSSNSFWWVEDDVYDYDEGTPEYEAACTIVDSWGDLLNKLMDDIFEMLKNKGIIIPQTGQIKVLIPFM